MYQLLTAPSLPQRLCQCAFQPILLTIVLSSLLTVWTSYAILISKKDITSTSIVNGQSQTSTAIRNSTSTATFSSITTTTATDSSSAAIQTYYTVNTSVVEEAANEYIESKVSKWNDLINSRILPETYEGWQANLTLWNGTISQVLEAKKAGYNDLLTFSDNIRTQLLNQSERVNETIDELSRTALTVGNVNGQEIIQNLSINYWFLDGMLGKVPEELQTVEDISHEVALPKVPNLTFSFTVENVTDTLKSVITNLTTELQELVSSQTSKTSIGASKSLYRRSNDLNTQVRGDNQLYKKTCALSICICVFYAVTVALLCIYEWIRFSWEKDMFKLHMADALEISDIEYELETVKINLQQRLRSFTRDLAFSLGDVVVYRLSNIMTLKQDSSDVYWNRLSFFYWWIWSTGKTLWILLFCTLIHWQVLASFMKVRQYSEPEFSAPAQSKSITRSPPTNSTYNSSFVYSAAIGACNNFKNDIDSIVITKITDDFEAFLSGPANEINSKMTNLTATVAIAVQAPWENFTSSIDLPKITFDDSLTSTIITSAINYSVTVSANQIQKSNFQKSSIQGPQETQNTPTLDPIFQWALIALTIAALIHHLFGFLILPRL